MTVFSQGEGAAGAETTACCIEELGYAKLPAALPNAVNRALRPHTLRPAPLRPGTLRPGTLQPCVGTAIGPAPSPAPQVTGMAPIELVIFDCDGTLMDSERIAAEVEVAMMNEHGWAITIDEFERQFAGTSAAQVREALEHETGRAVPDDHARRVEEEIVRRFRTEVRTVEGAHDVLDRLDQPRCICSNSSMEKLEAELKRGLLWDRFRPYIYSARDLPDCREKPAPDVFLHAAREFDVAPRAALVLEDSVAGVTAAAAAGCRVVGFAGGSHVKPGHADRLTEAGAETVINRLGDLPDLVTVFGEWEGAGF